MSGVELFLAAHAGTIATIGTGLAAFSAIQQGQAAANQANYQAELAARQAEVSWQQADRERTVARQSEEDFRRNQARLMATRRALGGVTGVETGTGSPLLASEDFASEVELQALRLRSGGETRATRLEQTASQQLAERGLFKSAAGASRTGGFLRGGSLLLSGLGTTFA